MIYEVPLFNCDALAECYIGNTAPSQELADTPSVERCITRKEDGQLELGPCICLSDFNLIESVFAVSSDITILQCPAYR